MPQLALGTVQLGVPYGIANRDGQPTQTEAFAILEAALEAGVEVWDTSPAYGSSEDVLGAFLARYPDSATVCTKLPALPNDTQSEDLQEHVRTQVDRSRRALGLDEIPFYFIHAEHDFVRHGNRLLDTLAAERDTGRLRHVGLSAYSPEVARRAVESGVVTALQVPYNVFDRRFDEVIREAEGVTVFARSTFLQGLFFLVPEDVAEWLPEAVPHLETLQGLRAEWEMPAERVALGFAAGAEAIDYVVVGVERPAQLCANRVAFAPLPDDQRAALRSAFGKVPLSVVNPTLWPR